MIPIIKSDSATIGFLTDALTCTVTEERNGAFELELTYPITGQLADNLVINNQILAKPNDTSENQLFRIYEVTKSITGIITVMAEHISYALANYPIASISYSSATASSALTGVISSCEQAKDFSVYCDVNTKSKFSVEACSVREALGGIDGSILDTYGGEYEFDNYKIKLHKNRGADNGVRIAYGKNLTDCTMVTNMESCYTHLFPYAYYKDDDGNQILVTLSAKTIAVDNSSGIATKVLIKDISDLFDDDETVNETNLKKHAKEYLSENDINTPSINLTIAFEHLWQSPEYNGIVSALEKVSLCDTVHVYHNQLGVNVTAKVITTTYDTLAERYTSLEIGSAKSNFADTIKQSTDEISLIKSQQNTQYTRITEEYLAAIEESSNLITGNSGGYVVLTPTSAPSELLIMNKPNIENATKLWRFNLSGLGYSSTGYNGTYKTAITMNGAINADFITAGTLTANIIRAGVLASSDYSSYFDLDTGELSTSNAYITGGYISIGSSGYRTVIADGSIKQYLSTKIEIGGMVPIGDETTYYNGLYVSTSSKVQGVGMYYQNSDGSFNTISTFGKSRIDLYKTLYSTHSMIIDGSIQTNEDAGDTYAGYKHYRTTKFNGSDEWTGLAMFGIGNPSNKGPSAALEVKNYGSSDTLARLDVFYSTGEAYICLRGSSMGSNSKLLELGAQLWWGGKMNATAYNVSSIEEIKENIEEQSSVLEIMKNSKIYNYTLIDDDDEDESDSQNTDEVATTEEVTTTTTSSVESSTSEKLTHLKEVAQTVKDKIQQAVANSENFSNLEKKNSVGFVIGRETPDEVISEDGKHIDLYSMSAITWKAVQELLSKIEKIESELNNLKEGL